jgi:hypothetical protein
MGGIAILADLDDGTQQVRVVDYKGLLQLFEDGVVEWPHIKDAAIDDRTQGDKLVKTIALIQIVWFFAQTLGRAIEGLAITTLELFTIGNVGCAIITYLAWWNKPNGVRLPIIIKGVAPSWVRSYSNLGLNAESGQTKSALVSLFIGFASGRYISLRGISILLPRRSVYCGELVALESLFCLPPPPSMGCLKKTMHGRLLNDGGYLLYPRCGILSLLFLWFSIAYLELTCL